MRKIKTIKIDDKEFTVKELTVQQVWDSKTSGGKKDSDEIERLAALCCPELTTDVAMSMAPSELKQIWDTFKEVNADFLELAAYLGIDKVIMEEIKKEIEKIPEMMKIKKSLAEQSASLSNQDTEALPGAMAGDSSSLP